MKPILFSTPMARAISNTKPGVWPAEPINQSEPFKWQTRRVIKPRYKLGEIGFEVSRGLAGTAISIINEEGATTREESPKYWPDDILWVRETFSRTLEGDYSHWADPIFDHCCKGDISWSWTSPRFMPREAARLFLEVKGVRIERVQDITPHDVRAEGWPGFYVWCGQKMKYVGPYCDSCSYSVQEHEVCSPDFCRSQNCYSAYWNHLNAKRGYSWESNPYVYVYEFMRVK